MKRMFVLLVALGLMAGWTACTAQSHDAAQEGGAQAQEQGVVDVGNKTCPVMGGPVDGEHFAVYKGKRYGMCCSGCEQEFLKDPEKYIKALKEREGSE